MEKHSHEKKPKDKIIIGRKPVIDSLLDDTELEKVWISKTLKGDIEKDLRQYTRERNIPLQYVPVEKLNAISKRSDHDGVVAQLSLINYMSLEAVMPFIYEQGRDPALLVLDGIEDVRNIGALIRSAVWFDFDAIVITLKRSAMINSIVYKTSAGALKDVVICREKSIIKAVEFLQSSGVKVIAANARAENKMDAAAFNSPLAIILGSEERGVSRELTALADGLISIPGSGKVESLNVSVAGALLMHEIYKVRNK